MSWQEIPGWLTEREAIALQAAASGVAPYEAIVEIGTWHGKSLMAICEAARPGVEIHWFDNYLPGSQASQANDNGGSDVKKARESAMLISLGDPRVHPHLTDSISGALGYDGPPVGLLYFDGHHDRAQVLAEIAVWTPHVAHDVVLVFHDFHGGFQLAKAVRHALALWHFIESEPHHSLACFSKI